MKEIRKTILREDYGVHSFYDRKVPLNIVINQKKEIIATHRNNINLYSSELYKLENTIIEKDKIRDILLIDNDLILAAKKGKLIHYKRVDVFKYTKYKEKTINPDIEFRHIINLDEKDLICAFSLANIYIININSFFIDCIFSLSKILYMDPRTKPFILSHKNHTICFRQQTSLSILDYKKMKIIKTIDLSQNAPFQLFKEEKENFFYLISIVFSERKNSKPHLENLITHIESIKFDLDLNILEKSKTKINMPIFSDNEEEEEENEEKEKYNYISEYDHYCIYRCIVKNVKNYSFILHGYRGPPFEAEWFWYIKCENGKIKDIQKKAYQYLSTEYSYVDYVFMKNKGKIISAFTDKYNEEITFD